MPAGLPFRMEARVRVELTNIPFAAGAAYRSCNEPRLFGGSGRIRTCIGFTRPPLSERAQCRSVTDPYGGGGESRTPCVAGYGPAGLRGSPPWHAQQVAALPSSFWRRTGLPRLERRAQFTMPVKPASAAPCRI